jgi:lactoylglutathione lyase
MTRPVALTGLFETHLTVSNLDRSVAFYRDVVGLSLALEVPERGAAFLWIGPGEAMLGLWTLGSAPMGLSLHVAFRATLEDVLGACDRLRTHDVTPLSFFATETDEPSVIGWMPAAAAYFRDPDGHLLEYLAMLEDEPSQSSGSSPGRNGSGQPRNRPYYRWREQRLVVRVGCPFATSCTSVGRPRAHCLCGRSQELGHDAGPLILLPGAEDVVVR